jgi:putative Holliday junction resolvase
VPDERRGVRLGVDVGAVRVGLAASDPHGILATPVETLRRDPASGADLDRVVAEAREREALERIEHVVGERVTANR